MRTFPGTFSFLSALIFSLFIFCTGCQKTAIQYGQQYIDNGITNIILVDSIAPVVSTIYKDSVPTSQSGTILAGSYSDPYFGKTTTTSYLQLGPPTLTDLLNNAQYDSLVLLMKCNGTFYGDTTLPITLTARQLQSEIKFAENQVAFYNIDSWPVSSSSLGTKSFILRPLTGDSANIRLSDTKGMELYNLIKTKSTLLTDKNLFTDYFKGLNISSTTGNNIFGFKDSAVIRLYYHQTDVGPQNKYFDFTLYNKPLQFNQVNTDRSGTPLTALNSVNNELLSTAAGNRGYLQTLSGLYLKISFPSIRKLLERSDFIKIIRADLVVKPIANSYSGTYPLPSILYAAQTDGSNEPGPSLSSATAGNSFAETGNLSIDYIYGINTTYSYDVTGYLSQEITNSAINKDGLLLFPPADSRFSKPNRLVIGDAYNAKNKLQLNVYYISVNK